MLIAALVLAAATSTVSALHHVPLATHMSAVQPSSMLASLSLIREKPLPVHLRRYSRVPFNCRNDEVFLAAAEMVAKVCKMGKVLQEGPDMAQFLRSQQLDCWALRVWNTDKLFSSGVWQRDDTCILAISGYHTELAGAMRTMSDSMTPDERWDMCGTSIYAPVVRLFRDHAKLANWSHVTQFLRSQDRCKRIFVTGESLGGSMALALTTCAYQKSNEIPKLIDRPDAKDFRVNAAFTFGALPISQPAGSNALRTDGCLPGKRIVDTDDFPVSYFSQMHLTNGELNVYPQMDALSIREVGNKVQYDMLNCREAPPKQNPWSKPHHNATPTVKNSETDRKGEEQDAFYHHSIFHYIASLRYIKELESQQRSLSPAVDTFSYLQKWMMRWYVR